LYKYSKILQNARYIQQCSRFVLLNVSRITSYPEQGCALFSSAYLGEFTDDNSKEAITTSFKIAI